MNIAIYGIFNGEVCRYIGRSATPDVRGQVHIREGARFAGGELRIVAEVNREDAPKAEAEAIQKYKAIGQCDGNKQRNFWGLSSLSTVAIGAKIKAGKKFRVSNNIERKAAIMAARFMGVKIMTRANGGNGFNVQARI